MAKIKIAKFTKAIPPLASIGGFFAGFEGTDWKHEIQAIISSPVVPSMASLMEVATASSIWGFLGMAVAGYVAKHIPIRYMSPIGNMLETAGISAAMGAVGSNVLRRCHNPGGQGTKLFSGSTSTAGRVPYPINSTGPSLNKPVN